jgi:hypothetical protein
VYNSRSKNDYSLVHILLKIVLALGVFSIFLIDTSVVESLFSFR